MGPRLIGLFGSGLSIALWLRPKEGPDPKDRFRGAPGNPSLTTIRILAVVLSALMGALILAVAG